MTTLAATNVTVKSAKAQALAAALSTSIPASVRAVWAKREGSK